MRSRHLKRVRQPSGDRRTSPVPKSAVSFTRQSLKIGESVLAVKVEEVDKTTEDDDQEFQKSSRPVRQRKITRKLEESYSTVPNSLLPSSSSPTKIQSLPTKRLKRQSGQRSDVLNGKLSPAVNTSARPLFDVKLEPIVDDEPCVSPPRYAEMAQELLRSMGEFENHASTKQFMCRGEIFDSCRQSIKEEPMESEELAEQEIDQPTTSALSAIALPKRVKTRRLKPKKSHLKTAILSRRDKSSLRTRQNHPERLLPVRDGSIFDDPRLKLTVNGFVKRLPKPILPKSASKKIESSQLRPMLGALIQGLEINLKRQSFQSSFKTIHSSVLKHAPNYLPVFIDIMRETQTNMERYGYFERKELAKSGEDRLLSMLTELRSLRLNVTRCKKEIKQEPDQLE